MKIFKFCSLLLIGSLLTGCIVIAKPSRADIHTTKELSLNASNLTAFDLELGAGKATVVGDNRLESITVTANIYTSSAHRDAYEFTLTKRNNKATLVAKTDNSFGVWQGESPRIDVQVKVPSKLLLNIDDGSGDLDVSEMKNDISIRDGSGSIVVSNIDGNLIVNDGSGEITINNVVGKLFVDDGSGQLNISHVAGDVKIIDGSGGLSVNDVQGNVDIDDGSGGMSVINIEGMVTINDGSGGIEVDQAGGLNLLEAGSGGLSISNVKGNVTIDQ